ncbi:hypothetical protein N9B73_02530 [Verrucomicrobiales bacterium]|nr:hypothetical protein [Verrucomicrobiales bacterium]
MRFPWQKKKNEVHNVATNRFENEAGEFDAIVIGLNIHDPDSFGEFVSEVVELFKNQRMISPPDTANMTITMEGECSAQEFVDHWNRVGENDEMLKVFMDMMIFADVLCFDESGVTDQASLLPGESK